MRLSVKLSMSASLCLIVSVSCIISARPDFISFNQQTPSDEQSTESQALSWFVSENDLDTRSVMARSRTGSAKLPEELESWTHSWLHSLLHKSLYRSLHSALDLHNCYTDFDHLFVL